MGQNIWKELKRLELIGGPLWVALLSTQYFWIAPLKQTEINMVGKKMHRQKSGMNFM